MHLLLSIKPYYAAEIYSGRKTAEYRRSPPRRALPGLAFLYETHPVSAVTGQVEMGAPQLLTEGELMQADADIAAYLAGARAPCALPILRATRFGMPIGLRDFVPGGMRAPQSWCYVALPGVSE